MNDFNTKLAAALSRAGSLNGVESEDSDYDIVIRGRHLDDYLAVLYMGRLLESGQMEVKIAPSKIEYLFKLLHINEEEVC